MPTMLVTLYGGLVTGCPRVAGVFNNRGQVRLLATASGRVFVALAAAAAAAAAAWVATAIAVYLFGRGVSVACGVFPSCGCGPSVFCSPSVFSSFLFFFLSWSPGVSFSWGPVLLFLFLGFLVFRLFLLWFFVLRRLVLRLGLLRRLGLRRFGWRS